jgi:hypothetical protein
MKRVLEHGSLHAVVHAREDEAFKDLVIDIVADFGWEAEQDRALLGAVF